jgi:hypothetical protein
MRIGNGRPRKKTSFFGILFLARIGISLQKKTQEKSVEASIIIMGRAGENPPQPETFLFFGEEK